VLYIKLQDHNHKAVILESRSAQDGYYQVKGPAAILQSHSDEHVAWTGSHLVQFIRSVMGLSESTWLATTALAIMKRVGGTSILYLPAA
jgi:hypothetical protein